MNHFAYTQQTPSSFNRNTIDEQALAQTELYSHLEDQAQAIAPEKIISVEISFYDHEIYANSQLIAQITYNHSDFVTQRWLVMVNDKEEFCADTWSKCYRYICTHYKDKTLPKQQEQEVLSTTGNEKMAQIANECENYGFDLMDDGIYNCDVKLGEVGYSEDFWWVIRASEEHKGRMLCKSAVDAVLALSKVSTDVKSLPQQEIRKLVAA